MKDADKLKWYVWILIGMILGMLIGIAVYISQVDYDLRSTPTPDVTVEWVYHGDPLSRPTRTPTPEPTPRTEPLSLVIEVSSIGNRYGACSGWVYTARPLPEDDPAFIAPFRMLKREYRPAFVGDGYSYYVASNPLWGCAAMKAALKKATEGD